MSHQGNNAVKEAENQFPALPGRTDMKTTPKALTVIGIKKIQKEVPPKQRREIPDGLLRSFFIVQQPTGALSFAVRYRMGGKTRKYTIGSYPKISLDTARALAKDAIADVAKGEDPGE